MGLSSRAFPVFLLLDFRQKMKMMTATMTQTTMAVAAGTMMLSRRLEPPPTPSVLISRHCSNGTLLGVISTSSSETTQTTIHSWSRKYQLVNKTETHNELTLSGTFLILNSRSLGAKGGPCLN